MGSTVEESCFILRVRDGLMTADSNEEVRTLHALTFVLLMRN